MGASIPAALLEAVPDPLFVLGRDGRLVYANAAFAALAGSEASTLPGAPLADLELTIGHADAIAAALDGVLESGEPTRGETSLPLDPARTFEWTMEPIRDADGEVALIAGVGHETTGWRALERDLRRAEEQAADLTRHAPTGIYEIDFTGPRFTEVNDAMCIMSGFSRDELLAMDPMELIAPASRPVFAERLASLREGREPTGQVEYRIVRKDGAELFVELQVRFVPDENGARTRAVVIGHDVTERRRAARERERLLESEKAARRQAKRELERTRILLEAERAIARERSLEDVLGVLCDVLMAATGHARVTVGLTGGDDDGFEIVACRGVPEVPNGVRARLEELSAPARNAVAGRRSVVVDYDALDEGARGVGDAFPSHLALAIPLLFRDRVVGLLTIDDPLQRREFSRRDVELGEGIAAQAAAAVVNARLLESERVAAERERERSDHLSLLRELADVGVSSRRRAETARRQLEILSSHLGLLGAFICLVDDSGAVLEPLAGVGIPLDVFMAYGPIAVTDGTGLARAYRTEAPVAIGDIECEPSLPERAKELLRSVGARSLVALPLTVSDMVIGTLSVVYAGVRPFPPEELAFLMSVATEMALGLQNAGLLETERARRHRIEALHGVMDAAVSTLDLHGSANQMLEYLSRHVGFTVSSITIATSDVLELVAATGYPDAARAEMSRIPLSSPLEAPRVYTTGQPVAVADACDADAAIREKHRELRLEIGSYVVVPLRSRGSTVGTLAFGWPHPRRISADDLEFYVSLGIELGVVLENARLYEVERDIADRLQEALLSMPGHVRGLEFAHAYRSATETTRVGGDFYDLFELDDARVGLVIGDVAGKGLDAAVLTSLVKNTIRASAHDEGRTPDQTLALTNEIVFRSTPVEAFATVLYGILDRRDGRFVYANAGHTTAALVRTDHGVARLSPSGPLLGAFRTVRFGLAEARIGVGELLFLYTDGLTEARRERELYGEERLFAALAACAGCAPDETVDAVMGSTLDFAGGVLKDDVAVLAVRRVEVEAGVEQQLTLPL